MDMEQLYVDDNVLQKHSVCDEYTRRQNPDKHHRHRRGNLKYHNF
jgi:hypothetical protein